MRRWRPKMRRDAIDVFHDAFCDASVGKEEIEGLSYFLHYLDDMANTHTCATFGEAFHRKYNLKRHENTVHYEDTSSHEDTDSKSELSESENEEQPLF